MGDTSHAAERLKAVDRVVDCDFHLTEEEEDFLPYLDDPFDKLLQRNDDHAGVSKGLYPNAGYLTPPKTGKTSSRPVRTIEDIREAMELLQTDTTLVTPGTNLRLPYVHHDELAASLANAYNDWILDTILPEDDAVYGAILVAPQKPDLAAAEIADRASESNMVAVSLPGAGTNPPLGDERYFPIYEAAERHGLPILIHCGTTGLMANFPHQWRGTKRYLDAHLLAHPVDHMFHLSTMLTNGIPERFPDLNFVLQEAGLGWIPYFLERYDNEYADKQYDAPLLEQTPSEYIRDQFYFTSQPIEGADNPQYIKFVAEQIGPENLLFSSDYPHFDFDYTDTLLNSLRSHLSESEMEGVYGNTAADLFDIPN